MKLKMLEGFKTLKAMGKGLENLNFKIRFLFMIVQVVEIVHRFVRQRKALIMKPIETQINESENWDYAISLPVKDEVMPANTVKVVNSRGHYLNSQEHAGLWRNSIYKTSYPIIW